MRGIAASEWLLDAYGWRGVFDFGAIVTAALIPVVMLVVPETAAYHASKDNLAGVNKTLGAFGKPAIGSLPAAAADREKPKVTDILSNPQLRPVTLLLAFGYMFHTVTFYYILKFAVQIVGPSSLDKPRHCCRTRPSPWFCLVGGQASPSPRRSSTFVSALSSNVSVLC